MGNSATSRLLQRFAELAERLFLLIRRNTSDDVTRKTADDGEKFRSEALLGDHISDNGGECVAIVETKRCEPVTAPAKVHGFIEPHRLAVTTFLKGLGFIVAVGSRLVECVLRLAQKHVLGGDEVPVVVSQP